MNERNEIDEIFFKQAPILKHNFSINTLGDLLPPKIDPVIELKKHPDTLRYAYLDEKKIYPIIINANFSMHEEKRLLKTLESIMLTLSGTNATKIIKSISNNGMVLSRSFQ